jgi:hypothetical protein
MLSTTYITPSGKMSVHFHPFCVLTLGPVVRLTGLLGKIGLTDGPTPSEPGAAKAACSICGEASSTTLNNPDIAVCTTLECALGNRC